MSPATHVRVLVLDGAGSLLLARRRDPLSAHEVWEPPGGAIDSGERAADAAGRELREETGIVAAIDPDRSLQLHREYHWKGERRSRDERIFLVRVARAEVRGAMDATEAATFVEWRWLTEDQVRLLGEDVYPAEPHAMARALAG
ncbi:MAG: NUDIX domain-containing protein [Actinomycetota bacterium]|nr:NUDIX domain-containing protein [Actinomycetota bacterium]